MKDALTLCGRNRRHPAASFACCFLLVASMCKVFPPNLWADETSPVAHASESTAVAATPGAPSNISETRTFGETELIELLTAELQSDYVKDRGELELRLTRAWTPQTVPGGPIDVEILDLPKTGVSPYFILRFELREGTNSIGTWQVSFQARVWREIWVARSALKRGESVADAEIEQQRRDVLTLREPLADFVPGDPSLEISQPLQAGAPVLARSVRVRPVIHRGQVADALIRDGALSITMKVEALEDGAPGDLIRARNAQTRRDLRGKVLDEQTILIAL